MGGNVFFGEKAFPHIRSGFPLQPNDRVNCPEGTSEGGLGQEGAVGKRLSSRNEGMRSL